MAIINYMFLLKFSEALGRNQIISKKNLITQFMSNWRLSDHRAEALTTRPLLFIETNFDQTID